MRLIIILFLIILICVCIYYKFFILQKESFNNINSDENVVFIIPSTSRNMNYNDINSCSLITKLYTSLEKLNISKYKFIVGFDDDDIFYNENIELLKSKFPDNFHFHFFNNYDKSYVCIVNQLADIAIQNYNAEYLYLFADDLDVYKLDCIPDFINYFKENNNLCLGWGIDNDNTRICTHPFIHKKHVEILGYFYPSSIKNWFCDDWITKLYTKLNKVIKSKDDVIRNGGGIPRYDVLHIDANILEELVDIDVHKINSFMS